MAWIADGSGKSLIHLQKTFLCSGLGRFLLNLGLFVASAQTSAMLIQVNMGVS